MKRLLLLLFLTTTAFAETIHSTNGRWFDGTGFRAATFYSVEGVLTSKKPATIDRTV